MKYFLMTVTENIRNQHCYNCDEVTRINSSNNPGNGNNSKLMAKTMI